MTVPFGIPLPGEASLPLADVHAGSAHLRAPDVLSLLDALDRLYTPVALAEFPQHLFGVLAQLLPGTVASIDFVDTATGVATSHVSPEVLSALPVGELEERVRTYLWQHPVLPHLAGPTSAVVLQPTDLISNASSAAPTSMRCASARPGSSTRLPPD